MNGLLPVVRHFVPCKDIQVPPGSPRSATLVDVISSIRATGTPPFPMRQDQLCVFVCLTECRGPAEVRIDIVEADTDRMVSRTPSRRAPFPNDPLKMHGLRFCLRDCPFPAAGLYWIEFYYEGHLAAQHPLLLR